MQTQSPLPPTTINGCPRRMITDRTYLKTARSSLPIPARLRQRNERPDAALTMDTIILNSQSGDRLQ